MLQFLKPPNLFYQRENSRLLPKRPKSHPRNTETLDPTCFRQAYMLNLDA
jgi:hypothetical protein